MKPAAETLAARVLELIGAHWSTQVVVTMVELGLPVLLAERPAQASQLAHDTGCDADGMRRLLRAARSLGLVREDGNGLYELTELGAMLTEGGEFRFAAWARWVARHQWHLSAGLSDRLREGSHRSQAGADRWARIGAVAADRSLFDHAMSEITAPVAERLSTQHDFSAAGHIVDVGGSHGEMALRLLARHRHLHATIFDLPQAGEGARARIAEAGLAARCHFVGGSFFDAVPAGADVYLLKSILHNWGDEACVKLLSRCRAAMPRRATLLVIERVFPPPEDPGAWSIARSDLAMLAALGGRERSREEMRTLAVEAGFELFGHAPLALGLSLLQWRTCARGSSLS